MTTTVGYSFVDFIDVGLEAKRRLEMVQEQELRQKFDQYDADCSG